jgi:hypothetical protein
MSKNNFLKYYSQFFYESWCFIIFLLINRTNKYKYWMIITFKVIYIKIKIYDKYETYTIPPRIVLLLPIWNRIIIKLYAFIIWKYNYLQFFFVNNNTQNSYKFQHIFCGQTNNYIKHGFFTSKKTDKSRLDESSDLF